MVQKCNVLWGKEFSFYLLKTFFVLKNVCMILVCFAHWFRLFSIAMVTWLCNFFFTFIYFSIWFIIFAEKPDYGEAFTKIVAITQGVRALDQDDDSTETSSRRKRASNSKESSSKTSSATGQPSSEAKKARTSTAATPDNASKEEAVKKSLRKISRKVRISQSCQFY